MTGKNSTDNKPRTIHSHQKITMAASPINPKSSYQARCISLPCRPHPISDQLNEQLCRFRSSHAASISSNYGLHSLKDLYDCVDALLTLPINQQTLSQHRNGKWIETILDASLRFLDICTTTRDALLQTKEHIENMQSALRRRCSGDLSFDSEILQYLSDRKNVKKVIEICLKDIKKVDKKKETMAVASMMKEVELVTSDVLKSLLIHIGGSKTLSKKSNWSLVTKLVHHSSEKKEVASMGEFEDLDVALSSLISQKKKTSINMIQVESLRNQMMKLDSEIQDLDEELESLYRQLVNTRATILNILSN